MSQIPKPNGSPGHGAPGAGPPEEGPILPGGGKTDYERYMKVDALLALQKPLSELSTHDELLFQTVHQTFELWCRQILFELETSASLMRADRPLQAEHLLLRAASAMKLMTEQIHLLDSMSPWDFHEVRRHLGRGSGAESPGFQNILRNAPRLWKPFADLLSARGAKLEDLYVRAGDLYELHRLAEALTEFDQRFQLWRTDHLALVKRQIGRDVKSLKGYAVHALEEDVKMQLYPELWAVRNRLTDLAGTSPK